MTPKQREWYEALLRRDRSTFTAKERAFFEEMVELETAEMETDQWGKAGVDRPDGSEWDQMQNPR